MTPGDRALQQVDLPAPLAPMMATRFAGVDREVDAEQGPELAVAGGERRGSRACQSPRAGEPR